MAGKRAREELSDQEGGRLGADCAGGNGSNAKPMAPRCAESSEGGGGGEVAGGEGTGGVTKGEHPSMRGGLCASERRLVELRAQGAPKGVGTLYPES